MRYFSFIDLQRVGFKGNILKSDHISQGLKVGRGLSFLIGKFDIISYKLYNIKFIPNI